MSAASSFSGRRSDVAPARLRSREGADRADRARGDEWPLVIVKELVDNAIDACEEAGIAPVITVTVDRGGITVARQRPGHSGRDGRGHPRLQRAGVVARSLRQPDPRRAGQRAEDDRRHAVRASTASAAGSRSRRSGVRHVIDFGVDRIRQEPAIEHARRGRRL